MGNRMRRKIVGVMGPGSNLSVEVENDALAIGRLIAEKDWVLLTGGRREGVMNLASKGAKEAGGLVVGVLPGADKSAASEFVDVVIVTDMGSARNNINVLSSDVVIACGLGAGTASEVCLALKDGKKVVLLSMDAEDASFFQKLGGKNVFVADSPNKAIERVEELFKTK